RVPESQIREQASRLTWFQHAVEFIDMKWQSLEGGSRRTLAESRPPTRSRDSDQRRQHDDLPSTSLPLRNQRPGCRWHHFEEIRSAWLEEHRQGSVCSCCWPIPAPFT